MPKRMLDSSYLNSPSLDRCSPRAQDAFPRFILLADDFGCFEADPRRLLALGWTSRRTDVTEADIKGWLDEYATAGMACLWTELERRYCYLIGWDGPHGQRKRAEYNPEAPKGTPGAHGSKRYTPRPPPDLVEAIRTGERRIHDGRPPGVDRECGGPADFPPGKRFEEKPSNSLPARECGGTAADPRISAAPYAGADAGADALQLLAPSPSDSPPVPKDESPVVATLLCVGSGPKEYAVRLSQVTSWQVAYPGVDVLAEVQRARVWLEANPAKRKTYRGCPSFLVRWLTKTQDGGGGRAAPAGAKRPHGMIASGTKHEGTPW